jgi:hypothetical protein
MLTNATVNEVSSQDRTKYAKGWLRDEIGLLIVIGLVIVGTIYLSFRVHPVDLPDLGQFFAP